MRRTTLLLLVLALLSGPAFAQGRTNSGVPIKRDGDRVKMGQPAGEPRGKEKKPEEKDEAKPEITDPIQAGIAALATWPDSRAREAATGLTLRGPAIEPILIAALSDSVPAQAAGICFILGEVGGDKSLSAVQAVAGRPSMADYLGWIFTSLGKLDGVNAYKRILPFLRHPKRPAREAAEHWLKDHLTAAEATRVDAMLSDPSRGARYSALRLLLRIDPSRARVRALSLLGDPSPEIALLAAEIAVSGADAERIAELNKLIVSRKARISAYATIAMVLHKSMTGKLEYTEEAIQHLLGRRGLYAVEKLPRGAAALALADIGYATARPDVDAVLDHDVVLTLLNTVGGKSFFPDYASLAEPARARFGLLTGQLERRTIPDLWKWWTANEKGLVARRVLRSIEPATLKLLRIRARSLAEPPLSQTLFSNVAADAGRPENLGVAFIYLSEADARSLAALVSAEILVLPDAGRIDPSRVSGYSADLGPDVFVVVGVENRSRTITSLRDRVPPGMVKVIETLSALRNRYQWQTYWDRDTHPRFEDFVKQEGVFFEGEHTKAEIAERMGDLILRSLDDLITAVERTDAVRALAALQVTLSDSDAYRLARFVELEESLTPFAEAAITTLIESDRALVLPMLAEWLEKNPGPQSIGLLVSALRRLGPEEIQKAAKAERAFQRRAAVKAAVGTIEGNELTTILLAATKDKSASVRGEALLAIGRADTDWSLDVLRQGMGDDDPEVANAAVQAFGLSKRPEAVTVLMTELRSENDSRRMACVTALCLTGRDEAIPPVLIALSLDTSPLVRGVAAREVARFGLRAVSGLTKIVTDADADPEIRAIAIEATVRIGGDHVTTILEALLSDPNSQVADAAAWALAARGRRASVPRLLDALENGRNPVRTVAALEMISAQAFPTATTGELPAIYRGWWSENKEHPESAWFATALTSRGYAEKPLASLVAGRPESDAVPVLIQALADSAWYVRANANLYLQRVTVEHFGEVTRFSTPQEVAAVQAKWRKFWEAQ